MNDKIDASKKRLLELRWLIEALLKAEGRSDRIEELDRWVNRVYPKQERDYL